MDSEKKFELLQHVNDALYTLAMCSDTLREDHDTLFAAELMAVIVMCKKCLFEVGYPKSSLLVDHTPRGLSIVNFTDVAGIACSLQKSCSGEEDRIWLGADTIGLREFVPNRTPAWQDRSEFDERREGRYYQANTSMHLNQEQVAALLPLLQRFVDTGELE
jgi:hypothetical protein